MSQVQLLYFTLGNQTENSTYKEPVLKLNNDTLFYKDTTSSKLISAINYIYFSGFQLVESHWRPPTNMTKKIPTHELVWENYRIF